MPVPVACDLAHGSHPGFGLNTQVQQEGEQRYRCDRGPPGKHIHIGVIVGLKDREQNA